MRFLRDIPIKRKLNLIAMLTTGIALALACLAFAAFDQVAFRRQLVNDLGSTAQLIGSNSSSALSFNDPASADQALLSLTAKPHLLAAAIYDRGGEVFATYRRSGEAIPPPDRVDAERTEFGRGAIKVTRPIVLAGETIGFVHLRSDVVEWRGRLVRMAIIFVVVMLGAGFVAYAILSRLQRVISEPISQLAAVAGRVASDSNYAVRAVKQGNDEIGALIDGFNAMLAQIQSRDAALHRAQEELEERVAERTRALTQEAAERRRTEEERDGFFLLSDDLLCIAGAEGVVRRANPAFERVLGYPAAEMINLRFMDLVHPADKLETARRVKRLALGRQVHDFENRVRCRDGSYRRIMWHVTPVPGKDYYYSCGRDITELKAAQEEASREKARLQFIFDSAPVGICLEHVHPTQRQRLVNDAHLRICGLTREQAGGDAFGGSSHPAELAQHHALRAQLDAGLINRFSLEKRHVRADGVEVWVAYSVQRRHEADGTWQDLSTVVDITELKRAQEEVAAERARFKFIFDSVPVGICFAQPGVEETLIANPAHARITGLSAADLAQPGAFERVTHPEDWERYRPLTQSYKRGDIDRLTIEKRYQHADGRIVWAALTRRMFVEPATGRKQSITTLVDITDLKAAQHEVAHERARFKFIFDVVPVGISLAAPGELDSLIVNPAHERITGISEKDARVPGAFQRVSHPDDYRRQLELTARAERGEIDHYSVEKRYLHREGRVVWAVLTNRTFTDPATGHQQSVTTLIDITERKQAEARLAETHKQLLDISRQAGMAEVATGVLHNVGNVLNSVNVSTTLLGDLVRHSKSGKVAKLGELLEEQRDLAEFFARDPRGRQVPGYVRTLAAHLGREQGELLREIESLRKNVEHIKDIVAMQQNYAKVGGVSEVVAISELVEDALRLNTGGRGPTDVALSCEFAARPSVLTEKHKVLQILVNLLRNAKHACDEAGRAEKAIAVRVMAEKERVKITVTDNGVGIPRENLTRIFSHGFTTRKHGHGFGLHSGAIAAKELGGSLTAQSEGPGRGATFTLELPLKTERNEA